MLTALQMKMTIVTHFHLFALVTAIEYGFYTDTVCEIGDTFGLEKALSKIVHNDWSSFSFHKLEFQRHKKLFVQHALLY